MNQEKWEENTAQGREKESESIPKTSPQVVTSEKLAQEVQEIITQAENTARPKNAEDEQEKLLRMEARKKKEEAENKISQAFGTNYSFKGYAPVGSIQHMIIIWFCLMQKVLGVILYS